MLQKKLLTLGVATALTVSTLTSSVFAASFEKSLDKEFKNHNKKQVQLITNKFHKIDFKKVNKNASITKVKALQAVIEMMGLSKEAEKIRDTHPLYTGKRIYTGQGYIYLAIEKKILQEEDLVDFNPITPAKRHEVAKYIIRALGMDAKAKENMNAVLSFEDTDEIPASSTGYVYLANKLGLITAKENNFQPNKPVTNGDMEDIIEKAKKIDIADEELPNNENDETNASEFVSLSDNNSKISVKLADGTTAQYSINPLAPVYINGKYLSLNTLKENDEIRLVFDKTSQIIFIEVIKEAAADQKLTTVSVEYQSLPDVLKSQIDTIILTSNYKAYKYNNQIYLIAARGQQNTGGYSINIKEVYKSAAGENKFNLKAVLELTDPAADAMVTQTITYPYSIVRIDNLDNIQSVMFNDINGVSLGTADLSVLDATETPSN